MIKQLSVLLQNEKGRLAELTRALSDESIDMHALTTADTADFGIIRIICDRPEAAASMLRDKDFSVTVNEVLAVEIPDRVGALASLFDVLASEEIAIEYSYCFATPKKAAADVVKTDDANASMVLENKGYRVLAPADLYRPDHD